jgi:hypothetical protein
MMYGDEPMRITIIISYLILGVASNLPSTRVPDKMKL